MAKSRSPRTPDGKAPSWVSLDPEEVVEEVTKLARSGSAPAQIGAVLRDTHGVPSVRLSTGKRVKEILREQNLAPQLPDDLSHLLRRVVHLQSHLARFPKDKANRRGLTLIESRIRRLSRYYKRKKVLPADWRYSAGTAALQVE